MIKRLTAAVTPDFRRGASIRSQVLSTTMRLTVRPVIHLWSISPRTILPPAILEALAAYLPVLPGTAWEPVTLDDCGAEWLAAEGVDSERAILYLHGGAFVSCGLNTHRRMVSRISAAADARVLNVDYRMLPRNTINHAVADGLAGYRWLLDAGYSADEIVVAGDSAGGYLAFMTALAALDADLPRPAAVVVMSPLLDLDPSNKAAHPNARRCSVFTLGAVRALTDLVDHVETRFAVDGVAPDRVSPVDADLTGLPPTLIQVGSTEMLLADAELMASRLVSAGVPCDLQVWDRQVHVFQAASWVPEAREAVREIANFVEAATTRARDESAPAVG